MRFDINFFKETFLLVVKAVPITLNMVIVTLLISIPIGFLFALLRKNQVKVAAKLIAVYVSFIRGTPIIVQIFLIYSMVPIILSSLLKSLNIGINVFDLNNIIYAYIVFSLNITAILSEVSRSGLNAVGKGQLEAAYSVGMSGYQGYKRIIMPQAITVILPVLCTTTTSLVKMSSLAFSMSISDIMGVAKVEAGRKMCYIEAYLDVYVMYLILCILIERIFRLLEKRVKVYIT